MAEIIDVDGVLFLSKGGPGSGRYPAGSGGGKKGKQFSFKRPASISKEDKKLYQEYIDKYGADGVMPENLARTQNTPPNTYFHVSSAGFGEDMQSDINNDIGNALYVGRDPVALKQFYGDMQDAPDAEIRMFNTENMNVMDIKSLADKEYVEATAKELFPDSKTPLADFASEMGFDAIAYFDPWATGEEFAVLNPDRLIDQGVISLSG